MGEWEGAIQVNMAAAVRIKGIHGRYHVNWYCLDLRVQQIHHNHQPAVSQPELRNRVLKIGNCEHGGRSIFQWRPCIYLLK